MRRPDVSLPISPKLFRHFAIVTLAITTCVAIFADGENRQRVEDELAQREAKRAIAKAEFDKFGARRLGAKPMRDKTRGSWGADTGGGVSDFGAPMDDGGDYVAPTDYGGDSDEQPPGQADSDVVLLDDAGNPVGSGTTTATAVAAAPPPARGPTRDELQRLLAASQSRSGSAGDEF